MPSTNHQALDVTSQTNKSLIDQLQSVAARSVLEMGYDNDQVLGALKKIKELRPVSMIFLLEFGTSYCRLCSFVCLFVFLLDIELFDRF
jgi:hypothetical protein